MLTIKNQYKLVTETIVVSKNGANQHWIVDDVAETPDTYVMVVLRKMGMLDTLVRRIRIQREKNELGMYSVQIIQNGKIIDKDQIRVGNIQTTEGMLNELKTIMEFI
jgi:hypothetical protein